MKKNQNDAQTNKAQIIKNDLSITKQTDIPLISDICRALSIQERLHILSLLNQQSYSVSELAAILDYPITSVVFHVNMLEKAKIIYTEKVLTTKGVSRICYINCFSININFFTAFQNVSQYFAFNMPIGHYVSIEPGDLCGIACADRPLIPTNDPIIFFYPERVDAQLIWMNYGSVSYNFPNSMQNETDKIFELKFSFEVCSEIPNYRMDFPSDITVWLNDVEILTFTSPGDFGGRRGKLTPEWWSNAGTQYGLLYNISVKNDGCFLNEKCYGTSTTLKDLHLEKQCYIKLKIGIKEDAQFVGGFNLFGEKFGDYPQNILMEIFTSESV